MRSSYTLTLVLSALALSLTSCTSQTADTSDGSQLPNQIAASEPAPTTGDSLEALAGRWLTALQENDADAFHACWPRVEDLESLTNQPPPDADVPSKEQFEQMRESLLQRDRLVRLVFPWMRRAIIDKCGSPGALELVEVRGKENAQGSFRKAVGVVVVLSGQDNSEIEFEMNTATFFNSRWCFSDKPPATFLVTTAGDTEKVFSNEYATEQEFSEFQKLIAR